MVETNEFTLSLPSYAKMYRRENVKSIRRSIFFYLLACIFIIGISIYGYLKSGTWEVLMSWIPFLIFYGLFLFFIYWHSPIHYYKNKDNKYSFTSRKYIFLEDKLELETGEGVNAKIPYSVLAKKSIGKDYFAFWETSITAYLIPFVAFESESDIETVKRLIVQKSVCQYS